jgi:ABC-2 type transport system ATP-binding protein
VNGYPTTTASQAPNKEERIIDVIATRGLTKYYDDLVAVDHLSMQVRGGEIFGFLGPNGAGKTTTIRMLVGLTTPSEGTATINGYDIRKEIVEVKRCVGVVPETSNLYNELTVRENLRFMTGMYHVPTYDREPRISELLDTFGLSNRKDAKFGGLSKGLKRRATIAAALVHRPAILFLDEPTSGLDVMSARALRQFLKTLRATGVTVFLTTHYIEEADQLCDRIAIIVKGRVIAVDTPDSLKEVVHATSIITVTYTSPLQPDTVDELAAYGQIEVRGNTVRMQVTDVSQSLKAVTRIADDQDLKVVDLNTVKPSLEDAFVTWTGVESEAMLQEKERRGGRA